VHAVAPEGVTTVLHAAGHEETGQQVPPPRKY
jgi:hypothetical protein